MPQKKRTMAPTTGQLVLLAVAALLLIASVLVSLAMRKRPDEHGAGAGRGPGRWLRAMGLVACVAVIAWHSISRRDWQPIRDNFEALLWLGTLVVALVVYLQAVKPIRGLDWLLIPVAVLLLVGAAVFGKEGPQSYRPIVGDVWIWVHRVTAYGGAVAFAVAAGVGAIYVVTSRRLRNKRVLRAGEGGSVSPGSSLESLERLMMLSVTLGFALLTVGLITGLGRMVLENKATPMAKLLPACLAWLVYAVVMHAPINPRFRGRRAAILSVFGFVLMVGTIVAVQVGMG